MLCGDPEIAGTGMPVVTGVAAVQALPSKMADEEERTWYEDAVPTVPSLPGAGQVNFTAPFVVVLGIAARSEMADGGMISSPMTVRASMVMMIPGPARFLN